MRSVAITLAIGAFLPKIFAQDPTAVDSGDNDDSTDELFGGVGFASTTQCFQSQTDFSITEHMTVLTQCASTFPFDCCSDVAESITALQDATDDETKQHCAAAYTDLSSLAQLDNSVLQKMCNTDGCLGIALQKLKDNKAYEHADLCYPGTATGAYIEFACKSAKSGGSCLSRTVSILQKLTNVARGEITDNAEVTEACRDRSPCLYDVAALQLRLRAAKVTQPLTEDDKEMSAVEVRPPISGVIDNTVIRDSIMTMCGKVSGSSCAKEGSTELKATIQYSCDEIPLFHEDGTDTVNDDDANSGSGTVNDDDANSGSGTVNDDDANSGTDTVDDDHANSGTDTVNDDDANSGTGTLTGTNSGARRRLIGFDPHSVFLPDSESTKAICAQIATAAEQQGCCAIAARLGDSWDNLLPMLRKHAAGSGPAASDDEIAALLKKIGITDPSQLDPSTLDITKLNLQAITDDEVAILSRAFPSFTVPAGPVDFGDHGDVGDQGDFGDLGDQGDFQDVDDSSDTHGRRLMTDVSNICPAARKICPLPVVSQERTHQFTVSGLSNAELDADQDLKNFFDNAFFFRVAKSLNCEFDECPGLKVCNGKHSMKFTKDDTLCQDVSAASSTGGVVVTVKFQRSTINDLTAESLFDLAVATGDIPSSVDGVAWKSAANAWKGKRGGAFGKNPWGAPAWLRNTLDALNGEKDLSDLYTTLQPPQNVKIGRSRASGDTNTQETTEAPFKGLVDQAKSLGSSDADAFEKCRADIYKQRMRVVMQAMGVASAQSSDTDEQKQPFLPLQTTLNCKLDSSKKCCPAIAAAEQVFSQATSSSLCSDTFSDVVSVVGDVKGDELKKACAADGCFGRALAALEPATTQAGDHCTVASQAWDFLSALCYEKEGSQHLCATDLPVHVDFFSRVTDGEFFNSAPYCEDECLYSNTRLITALVPSSYSSRKGFGFTPAGLPRYNNPVQQVFNVLNIACSVESGRYCYESWGRLMPAQAASAQPSDLPQSCKPLTRSRQLEASMSPSRNLEAERMLMAAPASHFKSAPTCADVSSAIGGGSGTNAAPDCCTAKFYQQMRMVAGTAGGADDTAGGDASDTTGGGGTAGGAAAGGDASGTTGGGDSNDNTLARRRLQTTSVGRGVAQALQQANNDFKDCDSVQNQCPDVMKPKRYVFVVPNPVQKDQLDKILADAQMRSSLHTAMEGTLRQSIPCSSCKYDFCVRDVDLASGDSSPDCQQAVADAASSSSRRLQSSTSDPVVVFTTKLDSHEPDPDANVQMFYSSGQFRTVMSQSAAAVSDSSANEPSSTTDETSSSGVLTAIGLNFLLALAAAFIDI